MSDYYNPTGIPGTLTNASSQAIRDQFSLTDQAFDKLAPLSGNGDKVIFVNSAGSAQVVKTAVEARVLLDLEIGVDIQAFDDGLQSIAGLTTAADKMIYTTASNTYAVTALTVHGRNLLDDTSVEAQRTTLGLGSGDTPNFAGLTLGGVPVSLVSYNWGPVITASQDLVEGEGHTVNTASGDVTMNLPSSMTVGAVMTVHHIDSSDSGNTCRIGENGNSITFKGVDKSADIILMRGESVQFVATGTNTAEITEWSI